MTIVGLLGTIHNEEIRNRVNCTLSLYKDIIIEFNPDIICGEVHPQRIEEEWFEKQLKTHSVGTIPFNSNEYDLVTREKYEWISNINPRAHNFRWTIRNQIMIERLKNTIKANPHKKILCIVGADHNYCFKEELENEPIKLVYPLIK